MFVVRGTVSYRTFAHVEILRKSTFIVLDADFADSCRRKLGLSNTRISNAGMEIVGDFRHLSELDLHRTRITDPALAPLQRMC